MLRNVTLKPFTKVTNVSPASFIIEDIACQSNKDPDARQIGATLWISQTPLRQSRLLQVRLAAGQRSGYLLAVKAPIFNEDFTRMVSADHDSRQKYARHIALVRLRMHRWFVRRGIQRDAKGAQKFEVRVVPGQREHLNGRHRILARVIRDPDVSGFDALHLGFEKRANLAGLNAILDVGPHPILDCGAKFGAAMHESHSRA